MATMDIESIEGNLDQLQLQQDQNSAQNQRGGWPQSRFCESNDFEEMITENSCIIDNTLFLKEVMDAEERNIIFCLPSKWCKTINLTFIEFALHVNETTGAEEDLIERLEAIKNKAGCRYASPFSDLLLLKNEPQFVEAYCGKTPTIFISLGEVVEVDNYSNFIQRFGAILSNVFYIPYLYDWLYKKTTSEPNLMKKRKYETSFKEYDLILGKEAGEELLQMALPLLCELMCECLAKKVVLLINKIDAPLQRSYLHKGMNDVDSDAICDFYSGFLSQLLSKDSQILKACKKVVCGCIFNPLSSLGVDERNHQFKVYTPDSEESSFRKYFSFSEQQVTDYFTKHGVVPGIRQCCKEWLNVCISSANERDSWYPPSLLIDFMVHYEKERKLSKERKKHNQTDVQSYETCSYTDTENFYWNYKPSKPIDACSLSNILFKSSVVKDFVYDVINDKISEEDRKVDLNKGLDKKQLKALKRIIDEGSLLDDDDDDEFASLYFSYLYGIGYLTTRRKPGNARHTIICPNMACKYLLEEKRIEFLREKLDRKLMKSMKGVARALKDCFDVGFRDPQLEEYKRGLVRSINSLVNEMPDVINLCEVTPDMEEAAGEEKTNDRQGTSSKTENVRKERKVTFEDMGQKARENARKKLIEMLTNPEISRLQHGNEDVYHSVFNASMQLLKFPKTIFGFEWSKKFDIDIKEIGVTEDDLRAAFTGDDVLDAKQLEALLKNSAKKHTLKLDTIFVDTLSRCGYIFEHKYAKKKEEFRFAILQAILYYRLINRLAKLKLRRIVFFAINYLPKPDLNGDRCQVEIFVYEIDDEQSKAEFEAKYKEAKRDYWLKESVKKEDKSDSEKKQSHKSRFRRPPPRRYKRKSNA